MSDSAGAAKRRRDRRLRAWHRHVRTTVAMELATALHHSAQRVEGPSEGEVHAKHDGLRAQKRRLPGTRPGLPPEPEPQVRAATVGYVAAPEPLLSAPLLADTAAETVDVNTVHFLLKALKQLKERRNMEAEEEERWITGEGDDRVVSPTPAQEEEEEEEAPSFLFAFLSWPRSSSTAAVACFWFSW